MGRKNSCLMLLWVVVLALVAAPPQALGQPLVWTGSVSNNWDLTPTDTNWNAAGLPSAYTQGSALIFDDTALPSTTNITLVGTTMTPSSMTFSNTTNTYTFTGYPIGGSARSTSRVRGA